MVHRGWLLGLLLALVACGGGGDGPEDVPEDVRALIEPSEDRTVSVPIQSAPRATPRDRISGQGRYSRALSYFRAGDHAAALREAERCVAQDEEFADAWYLKGLCHRALGDNAAAIGSFRTLVAQDPAYMEGYYALGEVLAAEQQYEEAALALYQAVQLASSPRNVEQYANVLLAKGDAAGAEDLLRQTVKARPQDVTFQRLLADALAAGDKPKEAQPIYEELLEGGSRRRAAPALLRSVPPQRAERPARPSTSFPGSWSSSPRMRRLIFNLGIARLDQGRRGGCGPMSGPLPGAPPRRARCRGGSEPGSRSSARWIPNRPSFRDRASRCRRSAGGPSGR